MFLLSVKTTLVCVGQNPYIKEGRLPEVAKVYGREDKANVTYGGNKVRITALSGY